MSKTSFSEEKGQLLLDLKEPLEKTSILPIFEEHLIQSSGESFPSRIYYSKASSSGTRFKWLELATVICVSILLFITMLPAGNESKGITENFIGEHHEPIHPIQRKLPTLQPPKTSAILQVGLFRQLNGAEFKQDELTALGLSPNVRKKVTDLGIMYALVISPENETERKLTLDILKANNIKYFQTKIAGS